ncbi:MAG: hypothetical protein ACRC1Z_24285 [Waterburya sp.]
MPKIKSASRIGQSNALVNIVLEYAESPEPSEPDTLEMIEAWG